MQSRWCRRKVGFGCLIGIILYILCRNINYSIKFESVIKNSKPILVWEYVADFSNMKVLNPTILEFSVDSESGNFDHWHYTVDYTEKLSYLPFVHNFARAQFNIRPLTKDSYAIDSIHQTCFFTRLTCGTSRYPLFCTVRSWSEFLFRPETSNPSGSSTHCTESVTYECPFILSFFCREEVLFQRHAIMDNLQKAFNTRHVT